MIYLIVYLAFASGLFLSAVVMLKVKKGGTYKEVYLYYRDFEEEGEKSNIITMLNLIVLWFYMPFVMLFIFLQDRYS